MAEQTYSRQALGNIADLGIASATAQYKVGTIAQTIDNTTGQLKKFIYIKNSNATLTAAESSIITLSSTAGAELVAGVPATSAVYQLAGVAPITVAANYYFWLQIYGDALTLTTDGVTLGNTVILANGVATVTDSTGAVELANSVGIAKTGCTGAGTITTFLLGKRVTLPSVE
jgi:hypothetical protein